MSAYGTKQTSQLQSAAGIDPSTVQRISRPFDAAPAAQSDGIAHSRPHRLEARMTQCSDIETTIKDFKTEVDYAIWLAVCGRPSPWLIDPKFKPKPGATFEERFMAGDDQILLWEINCCAQKRQAIPKWAADALYERLFRMAKGGVDSWDDVFGKPYADDKQRRGMATRAQMFDAYREVIKLQAENKNNKKKKMKSHDIYEEAGQRLNSEAER